ncbi:MAG TPA: ABC transporter ATP-binding protein [Polyangiaceae bacterium]|jgi:ABC-type multidrug transport system ATPase subunit|nr:ABC transporter ATP-binding protein [Polyangiaceae bacterium]
MLKIRHLTKWFGSRRVLDDVSLEVARGERVVVLGENGCGKSTLLQIVSGVIDADEGDVRIPDAIGYAPEKPDIPDHLLAREWLDLVASLKRAPPIGALAPRGATNELGVLELLGRKVGALSLGQRQRVSLVAAFTGDPPLLVLDEPTNALDAASREAVIARLDGATALIATHDRDFADRVATRVIRLAA